MRIAPQRDGVRGTHALPYHKIRVDFLCPGRQLIMGDFRVEIVRSDHDFEIRSQIVLQNGRNTAVTATAHSVDIKYDMPS